jgi:16S rRNA processing protein RimM
MREAWLASELSAPRPIRVLSCRIHLGQAIFQFAGVDTISGAEALRGLEVQIPLDDRISLGPGHHYITDLVGCQIWQHDAVAPLGVVEDVQRAGAEQDCAHPESWVLAVKAVGRELLIPLAAEICTRIDTAGKRIDVCLPEGLLELND